MRKGKSRSPPKLSNGRLPLILACLLTTCKNTDSQGCVSIYFTLYYLWDCWYFPNRQNKKSLSTNLSKIERNEVKQYLIKRLNESGITVLVSSHNLAEIQHIASYVGIIINGKLKYEGKVNNNDNLENIFMNVTREEEYSYV